MSRLANIKKVMNGTLNKEEIRKDFKSYLPQLKREAQLVLEDLSYEDDRIKDLVERGRIKPFVFAIADKNWDVKSFGLTYSYTIYSESDSFDKDFTKALLDRIREKGLESLFFRIRLNNNVLK